jgi:hypothetical protein
VGAGAVERFRCEGVGEDEACAAGGINLWGWGRKVPVQTGGVVVRALGERFEGGGDVGG